jgi:hypothetical protein
MNSIKYFLADYLIYLRIHTSEKGFMRVSKMADEHIQNCINLADTDTREYWEIAKPIFEKELARRDAKRIVFMYNGIAHRRPTDYAYSGGWDGVTKCSDCSRTALDFDMSISGPCPSCGGKVKSGFVGTWDQEDHRWITKKEK